MSWLSKTKLIQDFVSVKRPIDFVPRGSIEVLDASMNGVSRFCKQFDGDFVSLASDVLDTVSTVINAGDTTITLDGWVKLPYNALLSIDSKEFVQAYVVDHTRKTSDPTKKLTVIGLLNQVRRSYVVGTKMFIVGVPLQLLGTCPAGSVDFLFETTEIAVSGDFISSFHIEGTTPVLDAWQRIKVVQEKQEYVNSDGVLIRRYYCILETPTPKTIDVESYVYLKALPAYESNIFPVDLSGSYHVDAFTGKTLGKGSDDLTLTLSLYDTTKTLISTGVYAKNDVVVVSAFPASDFVTWRTGYGTVAVDGKFTCQFTMSDSGIFAIGDVFLKQQVSLCMALTLPSTLASVVYNSSSSYNINVRTLSGIVQYLYDTNTRSLLVTGWDGVQHAYADIDDTLYLDIHDITNFLAVEISGPPGVVVPCRTYDTRSISTPYSQASIVTPHVPVRYISYTYRADINLGDTWEGSCLMLKSGFYKLDDLHTNIDGLVLDSGQVFQ